MWLSHSERKGRREEGEEREATRVFIHKTEKYDDAIAEEERSGGNRAQIKKKKKKKRGGGGADDVVVVGGGAGGGEMKGYVGASAPPAKRRWKWFASAVLALVFFSLLVPLTFLLGLHNHFPSGYFSEDRSPPDSSLESYDRVDISHDHEMPEGDQSQIVHDLIGRFGPAISKDVESIPDIAGGNSDVEPSSEAVSNERTHFTSPPQEITSHSEGLPTFQAAEANPLPNPNKKTGKGGGRVKNAKSAKGSVESEKSCQLELGSYCLWSVEHKEDMKDFMVKKLKDQLFVARAYYPSIDKLKSQQKLSQEMRQNIQDHERMLSVAVVDADLPLHVEKKIRKMEQTIAKAQSFHVDCNYVGQKLRQILDLTEDEAHFHMRQSAFLYHLGIQTMPKSLHCLMMRLTVEYFKTSSVNEEFKHAEKLVSPAFQHYVIFSKNILASSVAINSTVMNSKESGNIVFHILTDEQNYYAMKFWFSRNYFKEAVIHVQNIEDLDLNNSNNFGTPPHLSLPEEFRISIHNIDHPSPLQTRTEYISVFGHAHFLLPDIFKSLKKLVVLDDDVVVQHDLSPLWVLDLEGKVNGALDFCRVQLGQLKSYLGGNKYDKDSCVWMSGLNIIDLEKWRELNVTGTYRQLLQEHMRQQGRSESSWRAAALPTSLLAFQDLVYPLNDSWVLSGLGTDHGVGADIIKRAAVLHYNGNMKPWIELGIPKYKIYWRNFLTRHNQFINECNVIP